MMQTWAVALALEPKPQVRTRLSVCSMRVLMNVCAQR